MGYGKLQDARAQYRYEAASVAGFVQQLATNYLPAGFFFYVSGWVPEGKDPRAVDAKLLARYGIARSRWSRFRRKAAGFANLHYLRFERQFLILATHGSHPFLVDEAASIRDVRRAPIQFAGYSLTAVLVGHRHRVLVRLSREQLRNLRAYFLSLALGSSAEELGRRFYAVPFEPYRPVRLQLLELVAEVNAVRKRADLELVRESAVRTKRDIVFVFAGGGPVDTAA
jgi:hypothetical protein